MAKTNSNEVKSTKKREKSTKLPDPPIFSDNIKVKWDDWYAKIIRKLTINTDYYLTETARIKYIILRIEGDTIDYTLARRLRNYLNLYRLHTEIFEDLAKVYKDLDRIANSDREYTALQIDTIGKFIEFYSKYVRLEAIYRYYNNVLIR